MLIAEWIPDRTLGGGHDGIEDVLQDVARQSDGIDLHDLRGVVMIEDRSGFVLVDLNASSNDFLIGIIGSILLLGPFLHPSDQRIAVLADEMDHTEDLDMVFEDPGLFHASRNAIEQEQIRIGFVLVGVDESLDVLLPESTGQFIWDQQALGGVLQELLAQFRFAVEAAEHVACGKMDEAGHGSDDGALGTLSNTWLAEEQDGLESFWHGVMATRLRRRTCSIAGLPRLASRRLFGAGDGPWNWLEG